MTFVYRGDARHERVAAIGWIAGGADLQPLTRLAGIRRLVSHRGRAAGVRTAYRLLLNPPAAECLRHPAGRVGGAAARRSSRRRPAQSRDVSVRYHVADRVCNRAARRRSAAVDRRARCAARHAGAASFRERRSSAVRASSGRTNRRATTRVGSALPRAGAARWLRLRQHRSPAHARQPHRRRQNPADRVRPVPVGRSQCRAHVQRGRRRRRRGRTRGRVVARAASTSPATRRGRSSAGRAQAASRRCSPPSGVRMSSAT